MTTQLTIGPTRVGRLAGLTLAFLLAVGTFTAGSFPDTGIDALDSSFGAKPAAAADGPCSLSYAHKKGWGCGKVTAGNPGRGKITVDWEDTRTDGSCVYIGYKRIDGSKQQLSWRDCDGKPNTQTISDSRGITKVYIIVKKCHRLGCWVDSDWVWADISPW